MDSWRAMAAGKVIPINCSSRVHLGLCSVSLRSPKYVGTAKPKLAFAGYFHPEPSLAWVGLWWFMLLAFTATIVEFFGDKVPALDHALHTLHMALAPIAGALAAGSGDNGEPVLGVTSPYSAEGMLSLFTRPERLCASAPRRPRPVSPTRRSLSSRMASWPSSLSWQSCCLGLPPYFLCSSQYGS
jgi:hypothetical protein